MAYSDTGVRGLTFVSEMAEFWYTGCLFPYRFRLTVHDGLDADVKVAELPVNEGDAVFEDGLNEPDDDPVRDATSWFWVYEE